MAALEVMVAVEAVAVTEDQAAVEAVAVMEDRADVKTIAAVVVVVAREAPMAKMALRTVDSTFIGLLFRTCLPTAATRCFAFMEIASLAVE